MVNKKFKVALIGCGALAESAHIPNLLNLNNVEIVGICDINQEKLNAVGEKFSIQKRFLNHQIMIRELNFDVAVVCTSADAHAEICIDLLTSQKDVFVEKPLALTSKDAKRVLKAVEDTGRLLQVGYQMRFLENHKKTKELARKAIGKLYTGRIVADTLVIKVNETLLIDYMTHLFDLIQWYFDEVVTKVGAMLYYENDVQTGAQVILYFPSGRLASVEAFWVPLSSWSTVQRRIELLGKEGKIVTDITGPTITLYKENSLLNKLRNPRKIMPSCSLNPFVPITDMAYRDELRDFFDCISHHREPICDACDGLSALLIAEAAKESHLNNRIVEICPLKPK